MTGSELIAAERQRQIDAEGYDAAHDAGHADELAAAAAAYVLTAEQREWETTDGERQKPPLALGARLWPWLPRYWKPTPGDRTRELVKAGALIAAAIDSRLATTTEETTDG